MNKSHQISRKSANVEMLTSKLLHIVFGRSPGVLSISNNGNQSKLQILSLHKISPATEAKLLKI